MESNITHTRGDTFQRDLLFADSAGTAINLSGSTILFTIKQKYTDTANIIQQDAVINADPATGRATITVPAATMKASVTEVREYFYDIQWTDSQGVVRTPIKGIFSNTYDVTA